VSEQLHVAVGIGIEPPISPPCSGNALLSDPTVPHSDSVAAFLSRFLIREK